MDSFEQSCCLALKKWIIWWENQHECREQKLRSGLSACKLEFPWQPQDLAYTSQRAKYTLEPCRDVNQSKSLNRNSNGESYELPVQPSLDNAHKERQRCTPQLFAAELSGLAPGIWLQGLPQPWDSRACEAEYVCIYLIWGFLKFLVSFWNPSSLDFQGSQGAPSALTSCTSPTLRPRAAASTGRRLLALSKRANADN